MIVAAKGEAAEIVSHCFYPCIGFQEDPGAAKRNIFLRSRLMRKFTMPLQ
jgi:hypothetical protein